MHPWSPSSSSAAALGYSYRYLLSIYVLLYIHNWFNAVPYNRLIYNVWWTLVSLHMPQYLQQIYTLSTVVWRLTVLCLLYRPMILACLIFVLNGYLHMDLLITFFCIIPVILVAIYQLALPRHQFTIQWSLWSVDVHILVVCGSQVSVFCSRPYD